jgi:mono/diheme cytochrome c family protein
MQRTIPWLTLALLGALQPAAAADMQRGRLLYETHCLQCHTEGISQREKPIAGTYAQVQAQVERWYRNIGLTWRPEEVDDVTRYLNDRFYRYPCTGSEC